MNDLPDNLVELAQGRAVGAEIPEPGAGPARTMKEIIEGYQQEQLDSLVEVPYAGHKIMPSALHVRCMAKEWTARVGASVMCGEHATHKLGEQGGNPMAHELTAYVCCEHFRAVMGRCTPNG